MGCRRTTRNETEIIVQASHDTGACYGVSKCAEIVFERGKVVKGERLPVLNERMETMDPDENEIYKFLGIEQADGIKTKVVFERREVGKRVKMLVNTELNDSNLISAINVKVIPVAAYAMNGCKFSKGELNELDTAVARTLIGGGGGCLFIYSCSTRLVSFEIKFKFINLKRN